MFERVIDLFSQEGFLIWAFAVFAVGCVGIRSVIDTLVEMNQPEIVYVQGCAYSLSTGGTKPVVNVDGNHVCKRVELR